MKLIRFEQHHLEEARALALSGYGEERQFVKELPAVRGIPGLEDLAGNGLGVAAFENGRMAGFLCGCEPFAHAFGATDVTGIFSPMGANAAAPAGRSKIYAAMYQAAGAKWVEAGAVSHAVCLYAHDEELQRQFYWYGFGLRCMDAIRPMEPVECKACAGYDFFELPADEFSLVYPFDLALNRHFLESPFFMSRQPDTREEFVRSCAEEKARCFVAKRNGMLCAYLQVSAQGETFAAAGDTYRHISGAYCLPEHRGGGLYQNLLNYAIAVLKAEGYTQLGVDFESFNPTARGFWLKYFSAYTHGVVRRIDERILRRRP